MSRIKLREYNLKEVLNDTRGVSKEVLVEVLKEVNLEEVCEGVLEEVLNEVQFREVLKKGVVR